MSSKITLYDSTGNPVELDGDMIKKAMSTAYGVSALDGASLESVYNIANITRIATGRYTVTFTTAMDTADYAVSGLCMAKTASYIDATARTTASFEFRTYGSGGSLIDGRKYSFTVMGGKD